VKITVCDLCNDRLKEGEEPILIKYERNGRTYTVDSCGQCKHKWEKREGKAA
jgi:hypothetical protein